MISIACGLVWIALFVTLVFSGVYASVSRLVGGFVWLFVLFWLGFIALIVLWLIYSFDIWYLIVVDCIWYFTCCGFRFAGLLGLGYVDCGIWI